ncbi:putative disease resistance protein RGA1 [Vicia villosa]|uniref:putative disease resistance protein RGA1 n=1 Tax=Vicia villosa TaxID=3911 RepID=UPI00273A85B9|nr:putative disease resistance protein RGA1 [Vicia villosa]
MAEALLGFVLENLSSLLQNEFSTIFGIKSKAEKLSTTLDLIKAVLEDAEQKQVTDRSVKVWLQQLKDAVYVLDDILDECSIQSTRLRGINPTNLVFRRDIGKRLKEITRRLDDLADSKSKFIPREGITIRESSIEVPEWRQTSSFIAEPKVFGREDDKEKIVEFLLTQAKDSDSLSIYPIVGLGGVGKTTLAQLVYNDVRVTVNFNTKIWVCVSEAFSVKRILCSIIESITSEKCDSLSLDAIQLKVQGLLQGKRYFLILDDVWNKTQQIESGLSQEKWNKLKSVLLCGSRGSSILVSTRDEDVAEIVRTCQTYHLSGLPENECWLLFKQYAFEHNREERPELVAIGKEIVKKCGGLPLAAQALGGLMRSRRGEKEWLEVKESRIWDLTHENSILPVLSLSYFHLTPTLKQCFSFCAIFPKDSLIMKEELIHLWLANGFISSRENLEVEDVGCMIWNELCQKSFFQDIKIDAYSGDISFKMHDLVHDLAQSIMGEECVIFENENVANLSKSTHHISFSFRSARHLSVYENSLKKVESLRTLFELDHCYLEHTNYFPANCSLRVLCISPSHVSSLGSLIHLRYLEFYGLEISNIPDSIYNLRKLEILKLKSLAKLICLPKRLACLQYLRHLVVERCDSLSQLFPDVGKLTFLRTLSVYMVRLKRGQSLTELRDLNLRGKLKIKGLKDVGSLSDAQDANLTAKKELQEVCMSWNINDEITEIPSFSSEQVLEGLQPHTNLKSLKIRYYNGLCFPSWIQTLTSLVSLELKGCNKCVRLSPLGKLPSLKKLRLCDMNNVKFVDDNDDDGDESHDSMDLKIFPSLEELILKKLPGLERLLKVERGEMFPCLSILKISYCFQLRWPCLPYVKDLEVYGCNNESLSSISSFYGLTTLYLAEGPGITSFPEGMFRKLTCLQTLIVKYFENLKELPNEPFNLPLERLYIIECNELDSLPEKFWEGLQSLRTLTISSCKKLRCLPEGIRHLTSLEVLSIYGCPTLKGRCKKETGEDWNKIAHIPYIRFSIFS